MSEQLKFFRLILPCVVLIVALVILAKAQEQITPGVTATEVGIQLYKQGNYESAERALRDSVRRNNKDADAWYYLGLTLNRTGDVKEAGKAFEKVIKLRPAFADAQLGLAYALLRLNKLDQAAAVVSPVVNTTSAGEAAHYILGRVALLRGSASKAVQEADAALKIKPDYPPALLLKSQALFQLYIDGIAKSAEQPKTDVKPTADLMRDVESYARAAAESLAKYIELQKDDKDIAVWREQLETLRAYGQESPNGEKPLSGKDVTTRAKVIRKPEPQYTLMARLSGITGKVILRTVFGSDGKVKNIRVVKGLPYGLTEAAIGAARKIKFLPAVKDGKPVSTYMQLEYNYSLH